MTAAWRLCHTPTTTILDDDDDTCCGPVFACNKRSRNLDRPGVDGGATTPGYANTQINGPACRKGNEVEDERQDVRGAEAAYSSRTIPG